MWCVLMVVEREFWFFRVSLMVYLRDVNFLIIKFKNEDR